MGMERGAAPAVTDAAMLNVNLFLAMLIPYLCQ
jgi:hypothetical protein